MGMLPPVFVELKASIGEFSAKMGEARAEMRETEATSKTTFTKVAAVGKGALLGLGAVAAGVGYESVKMAMEFEAAHTRLQTAVKNSGVEFEKVAPQIEEMSSKMRDLGFTDNETEDAMANLTTALGSPQKALKDMSIAADLARMKHIPLAQAAIAVAKAHEGFLKPLKSLGIDLPVAAGGAQALQKAHTGLEKAQKAYNQLVEKSHDNNKKTKVSSEQLARAHDKLVEAQHKVNATAQAGTQIMNVLKEKIGGQATAASETLAGKMERLKANTDKVFVTIGEKLIPILTRMVDGISNAITYLDKHRTVTKYLAIAIGTILVGAIGAYITKLTLATIASAKSFAVDMAKTIEWTAFKIQYYAVVGAAGIASAVSTAAAWIAANAAMILATGGIILAIGLLVAAAFYLKKHWKEIFEKVQEIVHKVTDAVKAKFDGFMNAMKGIFNGIANIVHGAFSAVGNIIKGYFNIWIGIVDFIIGKLNMVIDKANKVKINIPGLGKVGVNIPNIPSIPKLATGGIVNSPTVAMIGEAGPEAVVPLSRGGFGTKVTVHVHGSVIKEHDLAVSVRDNIGILMRRQGLNPNILGV